LLQWRCSKYRTYSECVFVSSATHHATRVRHIVICGLPRSTIFAHILNVCLYPRLPTMQRACAILPPVACPALQYFPQIVSQTARFSAESHRTENVCFDSLYSFVSDIFYPVKNRSRYDQKCILVFVQSAGYCGRIFRNMFKYNFAFSQTITFNQSDCF